MNPNCKECPKECIAAFLAEMPIADRVNMLLTTQNEWLTGTRPTNLTKLALSNRLHNHRQIIELLMVMSVPPTP